MVRPLTIVAACCTVVALAAVPAACGADDSTDDRAKDGRPTATTATTTTATTDESSVVSDGDYFPGVGTTSLDVLAYDITASVTIDDVDQLSATADLQITALEDLERVELDLRGMQVDAVRVDGAAAGHEQRDAKLWVTPGDTIAAGDTFDLAITYHGAPAGDRSAIEILEDGGGWVDAGAYSAVLGEPVGASTWLPSNDLPSDKATFAIAVTVPSPLEAVANGVLDGRSDDTAERTTTFRWVATDPMAPYLMTIVVGDLELVDSEPADGTPVLDAWPPGTDAEVLAPLGRFGEMMAFLTGRLGAYPFDVAGNVVVPGLPPTALETQTRSVLADSAMRGPDPDQLVVHELTHQWFGDLVTPATWADIWLNEGPAVYFQWSWAEAVGGPTTEESARISWDAADESMDVPPGDPGEDELFGRSVYERSAMFLIELERLMGTDAFDRLLRTWLEEHAGANATTEEFVELAGRIHGSPITDLSDPWLFGDDLPELSF